MSRPADKRKQIGLHARLREIIKYLIATPIFFIKEFPIHAAGAVCHSTFVISTSPFSTLVGPSFADTPEPVLDFGLERGSAKGTMADLGPFRHLVSTGLPSGGRAALLSSL